MENMNEKKNEINTETERKKIPTKAFDSEYMTEWLKEVKFLATKGIKPTFVRVKPEYNIRQYKYKKTPELFMSLVEFYTFQRNEKEFNKMNELIDAIGKVNKYGLATFGITSEVGEDPITGCDENG